LSSLQIVLIVAGALLVIGVIVYNNWQERRLKREARRAPAGDPKPARAAERVEPTLATRTASAAAGDAAVAFRPGNEIGGTFEPPLEVVAAPAGLGDDGPRHTPAPHSAADTLAMGDERAGASSSGLSPTRTAPGARQSAMPDHEIECLIPLQPAAPIAVGAIAAGLHARVGKALRWFGRPDARSDWQRLASDTAGRFGEIVASLLLADRNGPVSRAQLDTFVRIVGDIAPTLPAAFSPPEIDRELARAEALDRLCAELDVQIGLTVQKPEPGSIAGTRLRGVAEAAGFRLAAGGRFEYAHEETGAVLYTLQNLRPDPFTAESLRLTATNGVVFLLDVAHNADPVRTFDQMKLAAKRMATTLGGELVDDNHRALDDAAFAAIREQVAAAAEALRAVHIEPGSARALALFSA
jgi:hypothetical protein